jgi:hypothetical protein
MPLTQQQLQAIKADIALNPDLAGQAAGSDGAFAIAELYNAASTQDVWRSDAPVAAIYDAINWSAYTPSWTPSTADTPALAAIYTTALLAIQTKQMNLQLMTQGRETINAAKVNVRTGLRDAVTAVPANAVAGGVVGTVSPGGSNGTAVLTACVRKATRLEKLLSSAAPALGGVTANVMAFEGLVSYQDIEAARAS